jgi:outer membrane biosynthesis protein TonB
MRDALTSEAGPPANEEKVLAEAFPAIDASEEELARMAEVPPDTRLLDATPLPPAIDLNELEEEVAYTRVIVVRGRGIPVDKVISIGGSILLHALIVGAFLFALYFAVKLGVKGGGGGGRMARGVGGGPEGGYMITGELPTNAEAKSVADVLPDSTPLAAPDAPVLPSLPDSADAVRELVAQEQPRLPDDAMIGVPADRVGSPHVPPPPKRVIATPQASGIVVAPPSSTARNIAVLASASAGTVAPNRNAGGGGRGRGGDDDFGDETIIPLSKGDDGGAGGGSGGGSGTGIGRGASGANNPDPQILDWSSPEFPSWVYLDPPKRAAKFKVIVKANGQVGGVEVTQSCGKPAIDAMWKTALENAKYRPAYRAGRPYEAIKEVEYRFHK